jgi:hypothetical protein
MIGDSRLARKKPHCFAERYVFIQVVWDKILIRSELRKLIMCKNGVK